MAHVFLSYAQQDGELAQVLYRDLSAAGINVWRDIERIPPGMDWSSAISEAVESASTIIFLLSPNSIQAAFVNHELQRSLIYRRNLIVAKIGDVDLLSVPQKLKEYQWIDFTRDYESALNKLRSVLPTVVRVPRSEAPIRPKSRGYVFFSYAEEDSDFVDSLRAFFKQRGYGYWDYQVSERDYHSQLFLELENVIRGASATLSILSPDWKRSTWAIKEYIFSEEVGTPVFLLMVRTMEPTLVIAGIPYIDFTQDVSRGFDKLDRELARKKLI